MLLPNRVFLYRGRTAPRFARVIRHVQRPTASGASPKTRRGRELFINAGKKTKKCRILQNGVAHFVGLLA
jgi:hypothetical protein